MLHPGDTAPEFTLLNQDGQLVSLAELLEAGPVVLFFYPKAMSPGCTKESCRFRDLAAEFAAVGATCVGVSADGPLRQQRFGQLHGLGMPLLSDEGGTVAGSYGVKRPGPLGLRRMTFTIGQDGTVLAVHHSEFAMDSHADGALEVLKDLPRD